mgnify:FL=1
MKKLWTAFTCLLLVGVLAALSACGGVQSDGSVPGDYRSVTVQEAVQALEAVGAESPLGDPSAEGWSFGAKARAEASVTAEQGSASLEAEARSEMQLSIGAGEQDELIFLLACENSAEAHGSLADDAAADAAARANVYIDGENLYLDIGAEASAGGAADSSSYKKKIPLDLGIPSLPQIPGAAEADFASLLNSLAESGADIAIDDSDGVKVRASFSTAALEELLREVLGSIYPVDASTLDLRIGAGAAAQVFLVVDGEGQFASLSVKADFEATVAAATFDMATGEYIEEGKDISFRCKASAALEAGDVSVDLPGDLDTYPEGGIL